MQVPRIVTEKLTSWLIGKNLKRVYHPEGEFDKNKLIKQLQGFEFENGYKASIILMTRKQRDQCERSETWLRHSIGVGTKGVAENLFGCKIEIDDSPRWCVTILEEF